MSAHHPSKRVDMWAIWYWVPQISRWQFEAAIDDTRKRDQIVARLESMNMQVEVRRMISTTPSAPLVARQHATPRRV